MSDKATAKRIASTPIVHVIAKSESAEKLALRLPSIDDCLPCRPIDSVVSRIGFGNFPLLISSRDNVLDLKAHFIPGQSAKFKHKIERGRRQLVRGYNASSDSDLGRVSSGLHGDQYENSQCGSVRLHGFPHSWALSEVRISLDCDLVCGKTKYPTVYLCPDPTARSGQKRHKDDWWSHVTPKNKAQSPAFK